MVMELLTVFLQLVKFQNSIGQVDVWMQKIEDGRVHWRREPPKPNVAVQIIAELLLSIPCGLIPLPTVGKFLRLSETDRDFIPLALPQVMGELPEPNKQVLHSLLALCRTLHQNDIVLGTNTANTMINILFPLIFAAPSADPKCLSDDQRTSLLNLLATSVTHDCLVAAPQSTVSTSSSISKRFSADNVVGCASTVSCHECVGSDSPSLRKISSDVVPKLTPRCRPVWDHTQYKGSRKDVLTSPQGSGLPGQYSSGLQLSDPTTSPKHSRESSNLAAQASASGVSANREHSVAKRAKQKRKMRKPSSTK